MRVLSDESPRDDYEHFATASKLSFSTFCFVVLATVAMEELSKSAADTESPSPTGQAAKHHPILVKLICDQLGVAADQLMDFELCLADAAPAG